MPDILKTFVGKKVNMKKAKSKHFEFVEEDPPVLEKYLSFDSMRGFNAFSIELLLEGDAIKEVQRIGHVHMCGGQGTDKELKTFPNSVLEEIALKEVGSIIAN